ncbi:MAG: hypothetical protein ACXWV9_04535 [Flavisolibacter sp.]
MKPVFLFLFVLSSMLAGAREKKTVYYPNGKVQYEYEVEGHLYDGRFASYFETGKLRIKGQFINNQKSGLWRVWDENGLLRSERNYTNNRNFTVISESDSKGVKISRDISHVSMESNNSDDILFSHRYISIIERSQGVNEELFSESGLLDHLLTAIIKGELTAFVDDRFTVAVNLPSNSCYSYADVVSVLIKEDYRCNVSNQTMSNRVYGICPIVMENGKQKEMGWIYVPDLKIGTAHLDKIKDHLFKSTFIKTTVNDPSFKFRDVTPTENDMLRLMMFEFEANAILYTIDQEMLANL